MLPTSLSNTVSASDPPVLPDCTVNVWWVAAICSPFLALGKCPQPLSCRLLPDILFADAGLFYSADGECQSILVLVLTVMAVDIVTSAMKKIVEGELLFKRQ